MTAIETQIPIGTSRGPSTRSRCCARWSPPRRHEVRDGTPSRGLDRGPRTEASRTAKPQCGASERHPSPCPVGQAPALSPRTRRPAVAVVHTEARTPPEMGERRRPALTLPRRNGLRPSTINPPATAGGILEVF
jgi:hypothetical protein